MTIDFERNAGGYENVDAEDAHNTNWQEDASATMSECGCEDCTAPSLGSEVHAEHMAEFYG